MRRRTPEERAELLASTRERRVSIAAELDEHRERSSTPGTRTRISELGAGLERHDRFVAELEQETADTEQRLERVRTAAGQEGEREQRAVHPRIASHPYGETGETGPAQARDAALRTVDQYSQSGELRSHAADVMEKLVRDPKDVLGLSARYLDAVGDPQYFSAFGKLLNDPSTGQLRMTPQETAAIQKVTSVEQLRGLVTGTGSAGGFALPITIDPSIMLTSNGALNPIRQRARVITIPSTEWRGVSSAGVTASYDAEAAEVSDDTPTLAQPTILAEMARAFVPFSVEVGQDWGSLQTEMLGLVSDARDVLDATMFYSGTGTDQPFGVKTGLTTTQRVLTAGTAGFAIADVYSLKQAVPARFYPNATFAWHPNRIDTIYRFVGGSSAEPALIPERDGPLLGKPNDEWSSVPTALTSGTTVGLAGDFRAAYTICDRIGMAAEIVPHLFGASGRPTGQRGVFCFWRTGAKVVVPEALRYLETL